MINIFSAWYCNERDYERSRKNYERLRKVFFYSTKGQCKKVFTLHLRPYIPIPEYLLKLSCVYDILAAFKLSCKISHI